MRRSFACLSISLSISACGGNENPQPLSAPIVPLPSAAVSSTVATPLVDASVPADAGVVSSAVAQLKTKLVALPGATPPISFDYLTVDRALGRVYLAVSNGGSLDVLDIASGVVTKVDGFKTVEKDFKGKKRTFGPSSAAVGDGVVYVGDRATNEVCVVDTKSLKRGACLTLPTSIDGLAYVSSAKEIWVTTPSDSSLTVLDASKPASIKKKLVIKTPGEPEGFAVDDAHGVFFTNLEDKGSTLVIGIKDHKVRSTWNPSCSADGPRGVASDSERGFVFVACTDHIQVLDANHDGALLGKIDTGAGVDNIDYVASSGELIVGAGKSATTSILHVDDHGSLVLVATGATALGSRNAVGDANRNAYVPDPANGSLLVLSRK